MDLEKSPAVVKKINTKNHQQFVGLSFFFVSFFLGNEKKKENKQYSKFQIWQYTSHPVYLYSLEFIKQKINYIHQNPLRDGFVFEAEYYKQI